MSEEVRFDPETKEKVTYQELFLDLKDLGWTEEDILDYWDFDCQSVHSGDSLDDSEFTPSDGTPFSQTHSIDSWDHHLSGGPPPPEFKSAQRYVKEEGRAAMNIQSIARGKQAHAQVPSIQHARAGGPKDDHQGKSLARAAAQPKKSAYDSGQQQRTVMSAPSDHVSGRYIRTRDTDDHSDEHDYDSDEHDYDSDEHDHYSDEHDYQSDEHVSHSDEYDYHSDELDYHGTASPTSALQKQWQQDIVKPKRAGAGLYIGKKQENQMKAMREAEDRAARTIQQEFKKKHLETTMNVMKKDQVPNAFKRQHKPELVGPAPSPWHWKTRTPIGNPRKCIASPASWIMLARQRDLKSGAAGTYPLLPEHLQTDKDAEVLAMGNIQTPAEQNIANPGNWQALAKSAPKKKAKPTALSNEKSFGNFLDSIASAQKGSFREALGQVSTEAQRFSSNQEQAQSSASSLQQLATSGTPAGLTRSNVNLDANFVLLQEEVNRCKDLETRTTQLREKHHRQLDNIGRLRAESQGLHRLSTLGESGLRCHNCDLQLVNVYRLLGSLGSICTYLTLLARDQQGERLPSQQVDRQMLSILADALRSVSDADPEISKLYEFVSSSLKNLRPNHSTTNELWQGS